MRDRVIAGVLLFLHDLLDVVADHSDQWAISCYEKAVDLCPHLANRINIEGTVIDINTGQEVKPSAPSR